MGYGGGEQYISEIENNCRDRRCLFVINDGEALGKIQNQVDRNILISVMKNYYQEYSSSIFSIYVNKISN